MGERIARKKNIMRSFDVFTATAMEKVIAVPHDDPYTKGYDVLREGRVHNMELYTLASNGTEHRTGYTEVEPLGPAQWQHIIMWLIAVCIILANIPVFVVLSHLARLQRSMRYAMYSLAITDILVGVESIIRLIYRQVTGLHSTCDAMCHWDCFINAVLVAVSILTLSYISLDKCLTLRYPLHYKVFMTRIKTIVFLTFIWMGMILLFVPLLFSDYVNVGVKLYTQAFLASIDFKRNWAYTFVMMLFVQVIPSVVIVTSFITIWRTIRKQKTKQKTLKNGQDSRGHERSNDLRIIKTLFIMSSGFYIMWTPLFVTVIYWEIFTGHTLHHVSDFLSFILGGANSILNPFLYILTLDSYRRTLLGLIRLDKRNSVAIDSDSAATKLRMSMIVSNNIVNSGTLSKHSSASNINSC